MDSSAIHRVLAALENGEIALASGTRTIRTPLIPLACTRFSDCVTFGSSPRSNCAGHLILTLYEPWQRERMNGLPGLTGYWQLSRDHQLLCTIKGIGSLTAAVLLAEMARPGQVERARQAAAHAGLAPRREQRGSSVRRNRGLGKEDNRYLRKALYMPALVAIKYNAPLSHFASRLRSAGKPKMSIVCAVMHKADSHRLRRAQTPKAL